MSSLLDGWAKYFTTHSSQCDFDLVDLGIDSVMVGLVVGQMLCQRYFFGRKEGMKHGMKHGEDMKDDPLLMLLRLVTPIYALIVFLVNMECLEWGRVTFCCCLCVGVMFMNVNWSEIKRGIIRNDEGEFD